jgi:hypothetical protein
MRTPTRRTFVEPCRWAALALGLAALAGAAQAQCQYPPEMWSVDLCTLDGGLRSDFDGADVHGVSADVFYVTDGAWQGTVNSVSWVGRYIDSKGQPANSPLASFTINFFNTQNRTPWGDPIASFVVTPTRTSGQYSSFVPTAASGLKPVPLYVYEAALPQTLTLAPGGFTKPYAISIVADTRQDPNANFLWASTSYPFGFTGSFRGGQVTFGGVTRWSWSPWSGDPAYRLSADLPTTPVPEPGTWALMALGLVGLRTVARRRHALAQ